MAVGILIIAVFVAVLLVIAAASVLIVVRLGSGTAQANSEGGACGKCGYNVRGIESLACPECGADLREVGIVGKQQPRTGVFLAASVMWLISMSVLALAAGLILAAQREFSTGSTGRTAATWVMLCTLLLAVLACVVGVVWMHQKTRATGAALAGVLLTWGFCMTALLLAIGGVRF